MVKGGQKNMAVGKALKTMRGRESQLKISMDLSVSRESISAYETERTSIPPDISQKLMKRYDDPFFAMTLAHEYTNGSWVHPLDGKFVDLHRSSVAAKTEEELQEALEYMKSIRIANHPASMPEHEKQQLRETMIQAIDGITALSHYVAVVCNDYGFSWNELWQTHTRKLVANGYVREERVGL
jgi:hypothetical protein